MYLRNEPQREKTGLPTRSDTNRAIKSQKMDRSLKFRVKKKMDRTIYVVKTKTLISCAVTAQLICFFVFANAKIRFSHDAVHILNPGRFAPKPGWKIEAKRLGGKRLGGKRLGGETSCDPYIFFI